MLDQMYQIANDNPTLNYLDVRSCCPAAVHLMHGRCLITPYSPAHVYYC